MPESGAPGRARRLWIRDRLDRARRALDLLDRKRRILLAAEERMRPVRDRAAAEWADAAGKAVRDGRRADAVAGTWAVDLAAWSLRGGADVGAGWVRTVGISHPGEPDVHLPELPLSYAAASGPEVTAAALAARRAVRAAAAVAAAERSLALLRAELAATERRHRAVERARIPALEDELRLLELRLDELERQERVVARWVSRRAPRSP